MAVPTNTIGSERRLPNLNNYTAQGIVDLCAPYQEELNWLNKLTKYLKAGLHARLVPKDKTDPLTYHVEADNYSAVISIETYNMFSQEKAKSFLTEEQFNQCFEPQERKVIRFVRHPSPSRATG